MRTIIAGAIDYLWQDDDTAMDITMRAGILAAEEAIADAGIGTPGDFPGPLFAALPPAEMEWPYREKLYDGAPKIDGDAYDRMIAAARSKNDDYGFRHSLLGFIAEGHRREARHPRRADLADDRLRLRARPRSSSASRRSAAATPTRRSPSARIARSTRR